MYIKKSIFLCMFFFSNYAHSKVPLCISLGDSCSTAGALRQAGLRLEAYPFDWLISSFEALSEALKNDFKDFFADVKVKDNYGVVDAYGFLFIHDLPTLENQNIDALNIDEVSNGELYPEWEKHLPDVKEKYRRRVERFRDVCLGQEKIFFIRTGDTKENVIILRDILRDKYPQLDFVFIAISYYNDYKTPWNLERIKNFYSRDWHDPRVNGIILREWVDFLKQVDSAFDITHRNS